MIIEMRLGDKNIYKVRIRKIVNKKITSGKVTTVIFSTLSLSVSFRAFASVHLLSNAVAMESERK